MLTDEEIKRNKEQIEEYLRSTNREGIENLISFLQKSGYYYLHGSFKHHTYKGGLAQHSLEVLNYAMDNNNGCPRDSVIIASLLHDLCKTRFTYPNGMKFTGHGTKSVSILEDFLKFKLTDEERNAIRFHMGSRSFIKSDEEKERYKEALNSELWELVHVGDCISAGQYSKPMHGIVKGAIKLFNM